jgi:UDP-N-acetylglucosamine diphosphorylase / glucose-1-phosphate thymidylyltransferase / UDP-N-acetylgalactosamine diphosphorylase / glucosamine-1-phosphate N-acetyltransferase / galactosamine-1-phosphate N-acetyltransferase
MQAVILAAGRGTRMNELTTAVPKPMLDVGGKPLLEYKINALPPEVEEVILIIGYRGNVVRAHFGGSYNDKHIRRRSFSKTAFSS